MDNNILKHICNKKTTTTTTFTTKRQQQPQTHLQQKDYNNNLKHICNKKTATTTTFATELKAGYSQPFFPTISFRLSVTITF
jgi:hypothetical protein